MNDLNKILEAIRVKLYRIRITPEDIVTECEKADINRLGRLTSNQLEECIFSVVGYSVLTRRDISVLLRLCTVDKKQHLVDYYCLLEAFPKRDNIKQIAFNEEERWINESGDIENENAAIFSKSAKGSIGEWMRKASCPSEQLNFQRLLACLEQYEEESGLMIKMEKDKLVVPLGPDLRASVNFFIANS